MDLSADKGTTRYKNHLKWFREALKPPGRAAPCLWEEQRLARKDAKISAAASQGSYQILMNPVRGFSEKTGGT